MVHKAFFRSSISYKSHNPVGKVGDLLLGGSFIHGSERQGDELADGQNNIKT